MTRFENMDIFQLALRRKWTLAGVVLLAAVLGYVFSGPAFIRPKYKSTAVVYPVNIIPYSMESPTEQLLQLFHSADVRQMMIMKFDLGKHYGLDTGAANGKTKLHLLFEENVHVRKTEFESIKIDIYDEDPATACIMVNGLIDCANLKARRLQREKTKEVVKIFYDQLEFKQRQIDSLERIMGELRVRYGLLDYKEQSKEATKSYLKLVSDGASKDRLRTVDSVINNLRRKGGNLVAVGDQLKGLRDSYNDLRQQYDISLSDLTKELTYSNVAARPYVADSKSYPVRSLIVLVCAISMLMLGLILLLILERWNNRNEKASDV
ncbi:MAG TPA: hypothetical protein VI731_01185 [Bacteroidia bacterium]|nr:hypothetical protein [Bacteroidia bacterium]